MKMTELHSLLQAESHPSIHIQSHHDGVYFTVEIEHGDETQQLRALNGKPMVFRDEEAARNLLQQAGIKQVKARRILSGFSTLARPGFQSSWQARFA